MAQVSAVQPTVCEVQLPQIEVAENCVAFSATLSRTLGDLENKKSELSVSDYSTLKDEIRGALEATGKQIVGIFRSEMGFSPTDTIKGMDTFNWVRGCINPKHTDQVPSTVTPAEPINRADYRDAIDRLQRAALRAIKSGNFPRLGKLIDDLYGIYELLGEEETAAILQDTYHRYLQKTLAERDR